ncbi:MAG: type II toxin-antitoxin system prevent-host-death family antitoxin [Chitinophagaceae bacterium]|nr:type II toxin-antitoxin system prevent-host-death family antitoxin [Chitinophagaceae bacterium]
MRSVGAFEAKTHLAALLDAVSAGEQITITRHGRPVARLVPPGDTAPVNLAHTIETLKQFSQGQSLGGLTLQELREAGRR